METLLQLKFNLMPAIFYFEHETLEIVSPNVRWSMRNHAMLDAQCYQFFLCSQGFHAYKQPHANVSEGFLNIVL